MSAGVAIAIAFVATLAVEGLSSPTTARAICDPQQTFPTRTDNWPTYYAVGSRRTATVTGVRSDIEQYNPYAPSANRESHAVVQLVHISPDSWVKVGWVREHQNPREDFSHAKLANGTVSRHWYGTSYGIPTYRVEWSGGRMYTFMDSTAGMSYPTHSSVPDRAQIWGRIDSRAVQMPGGDTDRVRFSNANVEQNGVWYAFSGSGFNSNSTWFGLNGISTTILDIWDRACQS